MTHSPLTYLEWVYSIYFNRVLVCGFYKYLKGLSSSSSCFISSIAWIICFPSFARASLVSLRIVTSISLIALFKIIGHLRIVVSYAKLSLLVALYAGQGGLLGVIDIRKKKEKNNNENFPAPSYSTLFLFSQFFFIQRVKMSTATLLMQVIEALDPQSDVPLKDKVSILQTFSSTLKGPFA